MKSYPSFSISSEELTNKFQYGPANYGFGTYTYKSTSIDENVFNKIKDILVKNKVRFITFEKTRHGYFIRNGEIFISNEGLLSLPHELAHIVLINNFNKLLVDNWGFPLASGESAKVAEKYLLTEARVWGVESFITGQRRDINDQWLLFASDHSKKKSADIRERALDIINNYWNNMTSDKFLSMLDKRFEFVSNHIKNNPGFNSKYFNFTENSYYKD